MQAGARDAVELAEALDYSGRVGAHGVHGFEHRDEQKDGDDAGNDESEDDDSGVVHNILPIPMSLSYSDAGWLRRGCGELGLKFARVFEMQE